jgi:transcriptional regulator of arginine metabolism
MPTERDQRQRHILELVSSRELRTQEEVAEALARAGRAATQSSVSRDIATLGLVKIDGVYRRPRQALRPRRNPDVDRIADVVLSAESAGDALIVLKTPAGEANHVAVGLDRLAWPEIVGTIAGDDTIFVAVRDRDAKVRALGRLKKLRGSPSSK